MATRLLLVAAATLLLLLATIANALQKPQQPGPVLSVQQRNLPDMVHGGYSVCYGATIAGRSSFFMMNQTNSGNDNVWWHFTSYQAAMAGGAGAGAVPTRMALGNVFRTLYAPHLCATDLALGQTAGKQLAAECSSAGTSKVTRLLTKSGENITDAFSTCTFATSKHFYVLSYKSGDKSMTIHDFDLSLATSGGGGGAGADTISAVNSVTLALPANEPYANPSVWCMEPAKLLAVTVASAHEPAALTVLAASTLHTVFVKALPYLASVVVDVSANAVPRAVLVTAAGTTSETGPLRNGFLHVFDASVSSSSTAGTVLWGVQFPMSRNQNGCQGYAQNMAAPAIDQTFGQVLYIDAADARMVVTRDIRTGQALRRVQVTNMQATELKFFDAQPGRDAALAIAVTYVQNNDEMQGTMFVNPSTYWYGQANSTFVFDTTNNALPQFATGTGAGVADFVAFDYVRIMYEGGSQCTIMDGCEASFGVASLEWRTVPTTPAPTPFPPGVCNVSATCGSEWCGAGCGCSECRIPGSHPPRIGQCCGKENRVCDC